MDKGMKRKISALLAKADIKIGGKRPWDLQVNDERLYSRVLAQGSLGLGESYMEGWWECKALDQFFDRILRSRLEKEIKINLGTAIRFIQAKIFNLQSRSRAFQIGKRHYDVGNDLYKAMLDKRMTYTCGYWKNSKSLDAAQEAKLDLVCKKLGLKPGQRVLDIGCGWGSFMKFAAQRYKVKCVGLTVSREQVKLGEELCKGLPVEFRLQDYREINEKFDHVVSLGMFEHVGPKNYREYMKVVRRCLKDDGLFLLHTIGANTSGISGDPWIDKYIFPGGKLPSSKQIVRASEGLFVIEDWHNFGADYDLTLMEWFKNFDKNWPKLKKNYNERFYRMWKYYLLSCAGSFRSRHIQLWQIVFSKRGIVGGYKSLR